MEAKQNNSIASISFEFPLWGSRLDPVLNDGIIHKISFH
jgi:hypothetical protein